MGACLAAIFDFPTAIAMDQQFRKIRRKSIKNFIKRFGVERKK